MKTNRIEVVAAAICGALPLISPIASAQQRLVSPVLGFPEAGMDDPAAYQGYKTRFYRDTRGNVVQIYLDGRSGRVVNLLADAVDESVGFTVRDAAGKPVTLEWGSTQAKIDTDSRGNRTIEYQLVANSDLVDIGWILLGSMRVERDLGYSGRGLEPFAAPTFRIREVEEMVGNLERLEPAERARQLGLLRARDVSELRARLQPAIGVLNGNSGLARGVAVSQASLDDKTHLSLEITVDPGVASAAIVPPVVRLQSKAGGRIAFTVKVSTDGPTLTALTRDEIFKPEFLRFLAQARTRANAPGRVRAAGIKAGNAAYYRQLERDVRGTELLSSREKLMAGLPNYATYFGRDMMMTSLMMEPVWRDGMFEHVIASALRKLGPNGDVSHEEALGGQAIRENAAEYNAHMLAYFRDRAGADTALMAARALLGDLQRVRENYHMRDDEFQLPIIVSRYLRNPGVSAQRKKAFLLDSGDGRGPRIRQLLQELALVADLAAPYARNPVVQNLVASPRQDPTHWRSISWRDSNAGYANGRFAMDINAIWVPRALRSIDEIFTSLRGLQFTPATLGALAPDGGRALIELVHDNVFFRQALRNWDGAYKHFVVSLPANDVRTRIQQKLQSLPAGERSYWQSVLARTGADRQPFEFMAISLDEAGKPIPVANTDPATWLFLHEASDSTTAETRARALRDVRAFVRAYPAGLLIDRLGPVVANDAYAPKNVWDAFTSDTYHSPRVVWGREVNLITLGLAKQIAAATDRAGRPRRRALAPYVSELREALRLVTDAVEASGLKHNELWSYEITGGSLHPIRYGASTDVQLWNVTDLAVQYALSGLGAR